MLKIATPYIHVIELADKGEVQLAAERLGWRGVGYVPDRLADTLYAFGYIAALIGAEGAQEWAKDLFTEAGRLFEEQGRIDEAQSSQVRLAVCYWRQGSTDNALSLLNSVMVNGASPQVKAQALLSSSAIRLHNEEWDQALETLNDAERFVASQPLLWAACFHNQRGIAFKRLDQLDVAILEYELARDLFKACEHQGHEAAVSNNLAELYVAQKDFDKAHLYCQRSVSIYSRRKEVALLAKSLETCAKIYLAQGDSVRALDSADQAIRVIKEGNDQGWLPEILRTRARVYLSLNNGRDAKSDFESSAAQCEADGNPAGAALSYLSMMEEMELGVVEYARIYKRADALSADPTRMLQCARTLANKVNLPSSLVELRQSVRLHEESELIEAALRKAGGDLAIAAQRLGITRPGLDYKLKTHHKHLLPLRKPARKRSIFKADTRRSERILLFVSQVLPVLLFEPFRFL